MEKHEFIQWVEDYDNELHQKQSVNGITLDLQYTPHSYLLIQRKGSELEYPPSSDDGGEMIYFTLRLWVDDQSVDVFDYKAISVEDKQRKLYYFSYLFQEDIHLRSCEQNRNVALFHFERSNLKPQKTFVIAFESPDQIEKCESLTFEITSDIINSLPVKFNINIKDIPTLTL